MKKIISLIVSVLLLSSVCAYSDYDFSQYSDTDLKDLYFEIKTELIARKVDLTEKRDLAEGTYVIGKDIEPGNYKITCLKTSADSLGDMYSALGGMYSSLGDFYGNSQELANAMGLLGGSFGEIIGMTVEILGDFGSVLNSFELKPDQYITVQLTEGTAIKVSEGTCSIESI